jgi:uncharacterized membrane protein
MKGRAKFIWTALFIALATHFAVLYAFPYALMSAAMTRVSAGHVNQWRPGARVTEASRSIVKPSPDLAYSTCVFDLSQGPVEMRVGPWRSYWSLSLYQDNTDNFFVVDDREAHDGADIIVLRAGMAAPAHTSAQVVQSPSSRGIALVRRLAPSLDDYNGALQAGRGDICAALAKPAA